MSDIEKLDKAGTILNCALDAVRELGIDHIAIKICADTMLHTIIWCWETVAEHEAEEKNAADEANGVDEF